MRVVVAAVLLLGSLFPAGAWRKNPKPPDLTVLAASAHRTGGTVAIDGKVRNTGEKPIGGLVLVFDFFAPGQALITTQKSNIDEEVLAPGQESVFRFELDDPVRAVQIQINAVDADGRDLRVSNPGPFAIE